MSTESSIAVVVPDFLSLIEKVVSNPDISVEKMQALLDMQLQMEDRRAEREFDAALIAAQSDVQTLKWDKINREKNSRNVSYPKIDKMLRPVRIKHGFTQSWDTEAGVPDPMLCCDLIHAGGHKRRYRTPMPIDGQGPKGGGVMTKPQAVNSGTSYGMRNLAKMIFNIPMLVDREDTDGNVPYDAIDEKQIADLTALADEVKKDKETSADVIKKLTDYFKVDELKSLPASAYPSAVQALEKRRKA